MIPEHNRYGNLPPGVHEASWDELVVRFGYNQRRQWLLTGLELLVRDLRIARCRRIYIDGSFITTKELPGDIDCLYDPTAMIEGLLNPVILKTAVPRIEQKARYLCDVLPASAALLAYFQSGRDRRPKGILYISLEAKP